MSFSNLISQLSSLPGVKGRQFERLCQWYLRNAPEYRNRLKHVWLWDDWPGRWGPDAGIDLICETHEGDVWAVQAKAYEPEYGIKKSDLDTFLSESNRAETRSGWSLRPPIASAPTPTGRSWPRRNLSAS